MLNHITKIEVQVYHPVKTVQAQKNRKASFIRGNCKLVCNLFKFLNS